MTAELLDGDYDAFADLPQPEDAQGQSGPLSGSRRPRTTATGTSRSGRRSVSARKLDTLQLKLEKEMFQAGAMIGMGLNVTGYYICQESGQFTKAIVELASKKPEWIEALEHLADIGPGITVGRTVLGIGASFAVDRGRVEPDRKFLQFLGVTAAYQAVTEKRPPGEEPGNAYRPPPAGSYVPI